MTTTEQLAAMLRERHDRGLAKYGTTVDRGDLTTEEWAQHAIKEMLDGAAYLMRLKATLPEAIRRLEADNLDLRDRLAVALRQRDEALAKAPSVPEPGSTAAHHVEILRDRVKTLEAPQWKEEPPRWMREIPMETIMKIDDGSLRAFAAKMWDAPKLVEVPVATLEPGSTAAHHVEILRDRVKTLEAELAEAKASLAKAPSVPVGASDAPGGGGDSDRRRLEALERWLRGENFRLVQLSLRGTLLATDGMYEKDAAEATTIAALADKLAAKEDKP